MLSILGIAYITAIWLVLTSPVTAGLILAAVLVHRGGARRGEPTGVRLWQWLTPAALLPIMVVLGGVFGTAAVDPSPQLPAAGWAVVLLYLILIVLATTAIVQARRKWAAAMGMLIWLWVGAVVAWIALGAIAPGDLITHARQASVTRTETDSKTSPRAEILCP